MRVRLDFISSIPEFTTLFNNFYRFWFLNLRFPSVFYLFYRHECFFEKYTTCKIHKNYIRDPNGLFSIISHVSLSMTLFRSFPSIILSMSFCLCNKKKITWRLEDMNFIVSWQKQYNNFTYSLRSFVKYYLATWK